MWGEDAFYSGVLYKIGGTYRMMDFVRSFFMLQSEMTEDQKLVAYALVH